MKMTQRLKDFARELRANPAPAESIMWKELRNRRFAQFKFRRQCVVGEFITDFYCAQLKLVVELDGESHLATVERDRERQRWLEAEGIKVLRFWNTEVFDEKEAVLEKIWLECEARRSKPLTPDPSPPRGEGGEHA